MRINGTWRADELWGTDGVDQFYGRNGDDTITAGVGDFALGGRGNDQISTDGWLDADDLFHSATNVTLVGGAGDDTITGFGTLRGDEQAGLPERTFGNDRLTSTMSFDTDLGTQYGGKGHDTFAIGMHADGKWSEVDVLDFHPGEDKVSIALGYTDGRVEAGQLNQSQIWGVLDTNANGVLGDDVPLDGNSAVWSDVANNRLVIRLHEDYVVLQGVTHLNAADWEFV